MNPNALFLAFLITEGAALIGYDCGTRQLNVTTLSLRDVGECEEIGDNLDSTEQYIQLLQINNYEDTRVFQCELVVHRIVYYCGVYSHLSIVKDGENEYVQTISRKDCEEIHREGSLNIYSTKIDNIKDNATITHPITLAGHVDNEGNCHGATYIDAFGSWDKVVVQGFIKITLSSYTAQIKLDTNRIHLRSGVTCPLADGECTDSEGGPTFWDPLPIDRCKFNQYSILYEGLANKTVDKDQENDQVVYSLTSKGITFALGTKKPELVCGYSIRKTEHPKLVIFETRKGDTFATHSEISVSNLDIFTYINSKFVYVERHLRSQLKSLYRDVIFQRCNLERQTLKNSLSLATHAPDEFAYDLMKGPGYMAVVAGEVVHVVKCVPVEVRVEHGENCYAELQVTRNNETMYLTPRTHILKSHGTRMPCNKILPSYYMIGNAWYKILPSPTEALPPTIIKPMSKPTWNYVNPNELASSGIYSQTDLSQLSERIMYPVERPALLNDLARELRGHPTEAYQGSILKLLNEDAVEKIMDNTWNKLWQKFMTFGTASAAIIAILMIIRAIKALVDVGIRGYALHSIYGWSLHLLGAIWSSVAQLLIYLGNTRSSYTPRLREIDIEKQMAPATTSGEAKTTETTTPSPKTTEPGYNFGVRA